MLTKASIIKFGNSNELVDSLNKIFLEDWSMHLLRSQQIVNYERYRYLMQAYRAISARGIGVTMCFPGPYDNCDSPNTVHCFVSSISLTLLTINAFQYKVRY